MSDLDLEYIKAKQKVKDIRRLRRMQKKLNRLETKVHKPAPYFVFLDLVDTFLSLVQKPCKKE